jgi:type I restriction enzyme S subunit
VNVTEKIAITTEQRETLLTLLRNHLPDTAAWIYGSRINGRATPRSDLDMVVFSTPEQSRQVADLREAFEESSLPFRVDLFVWDEVPESFKANIESKHVVLTETVNLARPD